MKLTVDEALLLREVRIDRLKKAKADLDGGKMP